MAISGGGAAAASFARTLTTWFVGGVRPRVGVCARTNPGRLEAAAQQGLFYVYIMKLGTCASAGNYKPWVDYSPKAHWVSSWWLSKKLVHDQYMD